MGPHAMQVGRSSLIANPLHAAKQGQDSATKDIRQTRVSVSSFPSGEPILPVWEAALLRIFPDTRTIPAELNLDCTFRPRQLTETL